MIRMLFLSVALALLVLLPVDASAQPKPPAPPAAPLMTSDAPNLEKLLAIGVGVLAGVVAVETFGGADAMTLLAGVAGGYLAAWWYESGARATLRQPTAVTAAWIPGDLALAR
jgi:hypothetical protein